MIKDPTINIDNLLQTFPLNIYFKDKESRIIKCSNYYLKHLNFNDSSEIIGKTDFDFFDKQHAAQARKDEEYILKTGETLTKREKEVYPDGTIVYCITTKMPLKDHDNNIIGTYGISRDITEIITKNKLLENTVSDLKNSLEKNKQLNLILDEFPISIYFKDKQSRFTLVSKEMMKTLNCKSYDEIIGKTDFDFFNKEHAQIAFNDEQKIIKTKKTITKEEKEINSKNKERYVSTTKSPMFSEKGEVIGTFGISKDITAIKKAEKKIEITNKKLQANNELLCKTIKELSQTQKDLVDANESKSKFFSILELDINDLFNCILGYSEVLSNNYNDLEDLEKESLITEINRLTSRSYNLIKNMLNWTKIQSDKLNPNKTPFCIKDFIRDEITFFDKIEEKKNIKIELDGENKIICFADIKMISIAFRNILDNSIKYSHHDSKIKIKIEEEDKFAKLRISDQGIGIPQEDLSNLLEINNKRRTVGTDGEKGTGLGLLITKELITKNGGTISIQSKINKGTIVTIKIPLK